MNKDVVLAVVLGLFVVFGLFSGGFGFTSGADPAVASTSGYFLQSGYVTYRPDFQPGVIYLTFETNGVIGSNVELLFDEESKCVIDQTEYACASLQPVVKVTRDKRTIVEGERAGAKVKVRRLVTYQGPGEPLPTDSRQYITWAQAQQYFERCEVALVSQTEFREVTLVLKGGKLIYTSEPEIDRVFSVHDRYAKICGDNA